MSAACAEMGLFHSKKIEDRFASRIIPGGCFTSDIFYPRANAETLAFHASEGSDGSFSPDLGLIWPATMSCPSQTSNFLKCYCAAVMNYFAVFCHLLTSQKYGYCLQSVPNMVGPCV